MSGVKRSGTALGSERGVSLLELLVVLGILALAGSIAISRFDPGPRHLDNAAEAVAANVRVARAFAISRGAHYDVRVFDPTNLRVARLRLQNEADPTSPWVLDGTEFRFVPLPPNVRFVTTPGRAIEFDSAGAMVGGTAPVAVVIEESVHGLTRTVTIWPSGQVVSG